MWVKGKVLGCGTGGVLGKYKVKERHYVEGEKTRKR